jgi:hypothetical protein
MYPSPILFSKFKKSKIKNQKPANTKNSPARSQDPSLREIITEISAHTHGLLAQWQGA